MEFEVKQDCRYFTGDKPCKFKRLCKGCDKYDPVKENILIIKFAALGDVLRTTPLLYGLKEKYPKSKITWLTQKDSSEILINNPLIDEILAFNSQTFAQLSVRSFDVLVNLDKDKTASAMASLVRSKVKKGFGLSENGSITALDKDSDYALQLGLDDELKFRGNKKTYQEIVFEQAGLKYKGQEYILELTPEEFLYGLNVCEVLGVKEDTIKVGINTGAGNVFCGKKLPADKLMELIKKLSKLENVEVLLLGGPDEAEISDYIKSKCRAQVIDTGCNHTIRNFASIINYCNAVLAPDTVALHIAIAMKKPVVAIFGSTSSSEIELYGRGEKIASDLKCSPCYKNKCEINEECMQKLSIDKIYDAIAKIVKQRG